MKAIILCGGKGTRILEETKKIPKPMVKIGNLPIVHHIINIFKKNGINEFILAAGYKKEVLQKYFKNKRIKVDVVDTGKDSMTGGRILKLKPFLIHNDNFLMTYGDGLSNVNIKRLIQFHLKNKKIATVTAVRPTVRFGELYLKKNLVIKYKEKPQARAGWINGGFFVLNKKIFKYINNYKTIFEKEPLEQLSREKQLISFKHYGFWQCMDTMREKILLNRLWKNKKKIW